MLTILLFLFVIFAHEKQCAEVHSLTLFVLTFQGEIGEEGQKVNSRELSFTQLFKVFGFFNGEIWSSCFNVERNAGEMGRRRVVLCFQGEPGIGHRGPEGQAGAPGRKVQEHKFNNLLNITSLPNQLIPTVVSITLALIDFAPHRCFDLANVIVSVTHSLI